jgi:hypothetical protein
MVHWDGFLQVGIISISAISDWKEENVVTMIVCVSFVHFAGDPLDTSSTGLHRQLLHGVLHC